MKKIFTAENIKQFFSYFAVGGIAAFVEWGMFALFSNAIGLHHLIATGLAFVFSTSVNWILGRLWTFKKSKTYEHKRGKELALVFAASAIGLLFNELLMLLFVDAIGLDTGLLKIISKVLATGIVFFWNFLSRKLLIYKEKRNTSEATQENPEIKGN